MDLFGINGSELLILGLIAVVVLGPERLPEYSRKLAQWVRRLRTMADGARERLREEAGDELADMDWRKLDPRQYDPRKIIRDALFEDDEPRPSPSIYSTGGNGGAATASAAAVPVNDGDDTALAPGEPAPFDPEAT